MTLTSNPHRSVWVNMTSPQDVTKTIQGTLEGEQWNSGTSGTEILINLDIINRQGDSAPLLQVILYIQGIKNIKFRPFSSQYSVGSVSYFLTICTKIFGKFNIIPDLGKKLDSQTLLYLSKLICIHIFFFSVEFGIFFLTYKKT